MIAPDLISPGQLIGGRYRLRHQIAKGGMAEVWEAGDDVLGRAVAVKVLLPELAADPSFSERFRREAIAAARLAHPNIVGTFDTGVDYAVPGGLAYIVMELVEGTTLKDVLAQRGPLDGGEATKIAAQVAGALHYAHEAGIVHRDVKPANILLCPDGRVKVADFGIAKAALADAAAADSLAGNWDLTGTGMVVGTAKYLSPEQFEGLPVDRRADVYALGVVLYEMLCGRVPFVGNTDMAIGIQHVEHKPLSPRQVRAGIPRPLEAVVLKAMSKSPADRYPTAAALQSALLSVDLRSDDAVPMIVRDDTPPHGVPQTFAQSERSWMVPTVLIVVVAVTLGIVGVIFARSDTGHRLLGDLPSVTGGGGGGGGEAVAVQSVTSFDPDGDGEEHEDEVGNLVDGNPSTTWRSSQYGGADFAGLKPGLGFVLVFDGPVALGELELVGTSRNFDAEVALADGARSTRAAWGAAVASKKGVGAEATFDLDGKTATAVLVWITNPTSTSLSIGDVKVTAA
ncbi:MAG: eukaryotic-like serine/threonine-protein kinase [Actinomycetota bacterium]|nr:eukaryotic-like serine/threonine-protein kinase [Actinomycetota bacterium]